MGRSGGELGADDSVQADVLLGGFEGELAVDFRRDADQEASRAETQSRREEANPIHSNLSVSASLRENNSCQTNGVLPGMATGATGRGPIS
jgi:hypothetical protein